MANGTSFGAGDSGAFALPAVGAGATQVVMGWLYLPADPNGIELGITDNPDVIYVDYDGSFFQLWNGWGPVGTLWNGTVAGWIWIACVYSRTSCTFYWRRNGARSLSQVTYEISYDGSAQNGRLYAFLGDAQYWRIYQGLPTEAQLLAESLSPTPVLSCYSNFPLNENSGTGTIGGRNMTLSGTSVASREAPAAALGSPDGTISSWFGRFSNSDSAYSDYSVFADSQTFTISAWVNIGTATTNFYAIDLTDGAPGGEALVFVAQHDSGSTTYATNLMSLEAGDWATSYTTVTVGEATGWVFLAWVITSTGNSRSCAHYSQFGVNGTLAARSVNINPVTETGWSSAMTTRIGAGASGNIVHVRVHSTALNITELAALASSDAPDTTAEAHWPLKQTDPLDVSGNSRHLDIVGDVWPGVTGPVFAQSVTCTAAATLPNLSASASCMVGTAISCTVAATLPSLTASATASVGQPVTCAAAATLPDLSASATASVGGPVSATMAASLPVPTASCAVMVGQAVSATCTASLPNLTASAEVSVGEPTICSLAATLPDLTAVASLTVSPPALTCTAAATLPNLTASFTAGVGQPVTCTAAATLPNLTASATASVGSEPTCSAAATLPDLIAAATCLVGMPLTSEMVAGLPDLTASAIGVVGQPIVATCAAILPDLTCEAVVEVSQEIVCSGAATLPDLAAAFAMDIDQEARGTCVAVLPDLEFAATLQVGAAVDGTMTATLPDLTCLAAALVGSTMRTFTGRAGTANRYMGTAGTANRYNGWAGTTS